MLIVLDGGRTRVTIEPDAGGRIAQIEIFDGVAWAPLLHAPGALIADRTPLGWGCIAMLPWPNRIAGGRFTFDDAEYRVPVNDAGEALHGVAHARPWQIGRADAASCELSLVVRDLATWPWPMRAVQRIEALDDGLGQTIEVHALDGARFPAGCGWHPWFRRDVSSDGGVRVRVDADQRYELHDMIPTGRLLPVEREHDLRAYRALNDQRIDDCYARTRGDLRISWGDIELAMRSSANVRQAVVYTPAHAVCIEPQTCAIDAFNLEARGIAAGVAVVEPAHPLVASTEWRWSIRTA